MDKSFISEHSAEFILVPQFASILSSEYKVVVPIYFWTGREGNKTSLQCVQGHHLRVIAMYARRPKVVAPGEKYIGVKFNDILFKRSRYFQSHGIPVLAGVPNISTLMDLQIGTKCSWFYLNDDDLDIEEITFLDISEGNCYGERVSGPLSNEDILAYIRKGSEPMEWKNAVEIIRSAGKFDSNQTHIYWRFYRDIYKPVFFLLMD